MVTNRRQYILDLASEAGHAMDAALALLSLRHSHQIGGILKKIQSIRAGYVHNRSMKTIVLCCRGSSEEVLMTSIVRWPGNGASPQFLQLGND